MQLTRLGKIAIALGHFQFGAATIELLFQIARLFKAVAFHLPFGRHACRLLQQVGQFFFQPLQPIFAGGIVFFLQRLGLDLQLQDLAI